MGGAEIEGDDFLEQERYEREENVNIRKGLGWKRRHFFVMCVFVTVFLMIKLEFSYKKIFSNNIKKFLLMFLLMDMILEQLFVRLLLGEALLVSPILGTFVITEFIMTMGAEDLNAFILSYFIESSIVVLSRIYLGPLVERLELELQRLSITLSIKFKCCRNCWKGILMKQLTAQM